MAVRQPGEQALSLMQEIYDVVVIGAGPAAVAAMTALPTDLKMVVVTGASEVSLSTGYRVHPKINDVSRRRREAKGVARPLAFEDFKTHALFDTATVGGLANYWGQQFLRYEKNDPWPHEVFDDFPDYESHCGKVEELFTVSPKNPTEKQHKGDYLQCAPNLLVGTKDDPDAGLLSMREVFRSISERQSARIVHEAAASWSVEDGVVCLSLTNGSRIVARTLFLAAGVVGSLRLAISSCPDLCAARISDHSPYMFYYFPRSKRMDLERYGSADHFNSLRLERTEDDRGQLFASVYRMSRAPYSLTLSALGLPPLLPNTYPPRLADIVLPIQVWTENSKARYEIKRDPPTAVLKDMPEPRDDKELARFSDWLAREGHVLRRTMTPPGFGFHYHAGGVSCDGKSFQKLQTFLDARYSGRVVCVDSSVLGEVGVRPHTLTAMAAARRITAKHAVQ